MSKKPIKKHIHYIHGKKFQAARPCEVLEHNAHYTIDYSDKLYTVLKSEIKEENDFINKFYDAGLRLIKK